MSLGDVVINITETLSSILWWLAVVSLFYSAFCFWRAWENRRADIYLAQAVGFVFLSIIFFYGSGQGPFEDNCSEEYSDIFCQN